MQDVKLCDTREERRPRPCIQRCAFNASSSCNSVYNTEFSCVQSRDSSTACACAKVLLQNDNFETTQTVTVDS